MQRLASFISIPTTLVLALLFFLPWLEVSCDTAGAQAMVQTAMSEGENDTATPSEKTPEKAVICTATGLELAMGIIQAKPMDSDEDKATAEAGATKTEPEEETVDIGGRIYLWGALVLPIVGVVGAFWVLGKKRTIVGAAMILVVGGAGLWMCNSAMDINLGGALGRASAEHEAAKKAAAGEEQPPEEMQKMGGNMAGTMMGSMLQTEVQTPLTISLYLYILLLALGLIATIGQVLKQQKSRAKQVA
jgi:hypothetical protein